MIQKRKLKPNSEYSNNFSLTETISYPTKQRQQNQRNMPRAQNYGRYTAKESIFQLNSSNSYPNSYKKNTGDKFPLKTYTNTKSPNFKHNKNEKTDSKTEKIV